jgi:hypothetical protein
MMIEPFQILWMHILELTFRYIVYINQSRVENKLQMVTWFYTAKMFVFWVQMPLVLCI